jgi:hypothetical protein
MCPEILFVGGGFVCLSEILFDDIMNPVLKVLVTNRAQQVTLPRDKLGCSLWVGL